MATMVGRQVSRFRVLSRIGQGGMGEVYLAHDVSLDRRVAVKFVTQAAADDPDASRRLQREAHAIASLDHPFICKVYESGESDGRTYLAMEFVEGRTLKEHLAAGPLPMGDAVRLAVEIAEAVDCAHAHGVVHRDLKPANVMVGADGHIKVMDFGIAGRIAAVDQTTRLAIDPTQAGLITGTLAYSSPEQLLALPTDARSDVFSFGVLLHEMLAGAHPFERPSAAGMVDAILNAPPAPLSAPPGRIPQGLERVVLRCLEKDRERRYASFREIRAALQSGDAEPAPAGGAPARSSRRVVAAGIIVTIAAAAAALYFGPAWLRLSEPALAFNARDWILITDCENLTGEQVFDRSLAVALDVGISQSNYVNVYSRDRIRSTLQRMRRDPGSPIDLALASDIAQRDNVRAVLTCSIGKVGDSYSLVARLVDPPTQRIALTESVRAAKHDGVLPALDELAGRLRRRLGESVATLSASSRPLPQATTNSLEALKMFAQSQRLTGKDDTAAQQLLVQALELDPDFAMAHAVLGYRLLLLAETDSRKAGDEHLVKALSLKDRLTTRERMLIQAAASDARGNRDQAAIEYRSYLAQYPDDSRTWFRLGWTYMAGLSQYDAAAEAFAHVIAIDPKDSASLVNLASCYAGLRQYDRSIATYQKAFALNPDEMLGMFVNAEYGASLMHADRLSEAQAAFEKMAASSAPYAKSRGLRSLAFLDMYRGHYHAAIDRLRQAVTLNEASDAYVSVFRDRLILVTALLATGSTAEARGELSRAHDLIRKQSFSPEWLMSLAKVEARLGNVPAAERVIAMMPKLIGDAVVASAANRNTGHDQGALELAQAEIEIARRQPAKGVTLASGAAVRLGRASALDTLALATATDGRLAEASTLYAELITVADFNRESQEEWFAAHLALGRLHERAGRPEDARRLYERVAALWKDGDPDLVVRKEVTARLRALPRSSGPR